MNHPSQVAPVPHKVTSVEEWKLGVLRPPVSLESLTIIRRERNPSLIRTKVMDPQPVYLLVLQATVSSMNFVKCMHLVPLMMKICAWPPSKPKQRLSYSTGLYYNFFPFEKTCSAESLFRSDETKVWPKKKKKIAKSDKDKRKLAFLR